MCTHNDVVQLCVHTMKSYNYVSMCTHNGVVQLCAHTIVLTYVHMYVLREHMKKNACTYARWWVPWADAECHAIW